MTRLAGNPSAITVRCRNAADNAADWRKPASFWSDERQKPALADPDEGPAMTIANAATLGKVRRGVL
jgi:hypothetical protein